MLNNEIILENLQNSTSPHKPVLPREVLSVFTNDLKNFDKNMSNKKLTKLKQHQKTQSELKPEPEKNIILDCTLGYGGHTELLLQSGFEVIGCDRDATAIEYCKEKFGGFGGKFSCVKSDFASLLDKLTPSQKSRICGVLADIGVSSLQLDLDERGFGMSSKRLDMRMDLSGDLSAKEVVNHYSQEELERILRQNTQLPNAHTLASKIVLARSKMEIGSVDELACVIGQERLFGRNVKILTLVLQAIRIEVNDELTQLRTLLNNVSQLCDFTLCVISFHSLEDRIVKEYFKLWGQECSCPPEAICCQCDKNNAKGFALTKKPLTPQADEVRLNSRASCAKLRAFRFF